MSDMVNGIYSWLAEDFPALIDRWEKRLRAFRFRMLGHD